MIDTDVGWAGGENGTLLQTTDGALTWSRRVAPVLGSVSGIRFVDRQHGWLSSAGALYRTVDGGSSWSVCLAIPGATKVSFDFVTPSVGFALYGKRCFTSTDGGGTWTEVGNVDATASWNNFGQVDFVSETVGWYGAQAFSAWDGHFYGVLYLTTDAGRTWKSSRWAIDPNSGFRSVSALSTESCIAVGLMAGVHSSQPDAAAPGGVRWERQPVEGSIAVHYANPSQAWVVGDGGLVARSTDGGTSWSAGLCTETTSALLAVDGFGVGDACAVGTNGTIVSGQAPADGSPASPYIEPSAPVLPQKPAVVLVAGINADYGFNSPDDPSHDWHDTYTYLKYERGYDVYVVPSFAADAGKNVVNSLDGYTGDNAERVQNYLNMEGLRDREVIMIGHSMGGLIARKWAGSPWLWRSKGITPKAIIQLGTPNAGSPLAALNFWYRGWQPGSLQSLIELDGNGDTITHFNDQYLDPGVPVLKLGGNFFFGGSTKEIREAWPYPMGRGTVELAMADAFHGAANDGAVSVDSLSALPVAYQTELFPVMHSDATGINLFKSQGFIVPKRDTAIEDQILLTISNYCYGVWKGDISGTSPGASRLGLGVRSAAIASSRSFATEPSPESGSAFTTIVNRPLALSAAVTSTVVFSVEGTSALAQIACDDSGLKVAVKGVGGVVTSESQVTSDGVLVAFPTTAGGSYSLELRSASTTSAAVNVLDGGRTVLVVGTRASGAGGSDVLVTARLKRDSSNLTGSLVARVDDGSNVVMSDSGTGVDAMASDGVYSASVHLPDSGMAARVTVDASATGGIQRTGFGLTEIVEPRATISGTPTLSKGLTSSGKVGQVFVDVPVDASMDCTVQVAADLGPAGLLIAQSMSQKALASGSSSVARVIFDAEDLDALPDGASAVVASIKLYDSTDGGLSLLDSAASSSMVLARTDLALAECMIDSFDKPVSSEPVIITGAASCTSETISGVDISLDGGSEWLVVPEPSSGWGSNETTWSCAFTLSDGEYGASVRLRGANGLIAGATDSLVFSVDRTAPTGTMNIAGGAQFAAASFAIQSSVTGATEMRVRSSTNGTPWSGWSGWTTYDPSIDMGVANTSQKWWYQLEYRDEAGNVLALTDDVMVDATSPVTTADARPVYGDAASMMLTATDGSLSGVNKTEWRLDGGAWNSGTLISTSTRGVHTLEFRSTDAVGNTEAIKSVNFEVRHPSSLAVTGPSASSLTFGSVFAIKGTLMGGGAGISGQNVVLQSAAPGVAFTDTTLVATTDDRGAFVFSPKPTTNTYYRVRFAGSTGWMASTQASSVYATPKVDLSRSTSWSSLRVNKTYYAKGTISPKHSTSDSNKVRIRAYKRAANGKYYHKKSFTAKYSYYSSSKTRYKASVKLPSKGKWKLVAYHAADSKNAKTYGSVDYVTLK